MKTEPYKGVRDFYPEDMVVQNYIFSVWREVAEKKMSDLNANDIEAAMKIIEGTAKNMGITVEG